MLFGIQDNTGYGEIFVQSGVWYQILYLNIVIL